MELNSSKLGLCEVEIYVDRLSAVDSYITKGYHVETGENLTNASLDILQNEFEAEVFDYAYNNGSRNHN